MLACGLPAPVTVAAASRRLGSLLRPGSLVRGVAQHATDSEAPQPPPLEPGLYVVSTPIGNLEDITLRALRVLRSASLILAEDTRHSAKLLQVYGIRTPCLSFHAHNEHQREGSIIARLKANEAIALVSDAGTPAISDPGAQLVAAAVAAGVRVLPVPGACAAVAALAASGLATDAWHFVGFLPPKQGKRAAALEQLRGVPATLVFYASPHSLAAVLADAAAALGPQRQAVLARELTKLHEEFFRGSLNEVVAEFGPAGRRGGQVKGELVLLVQGAAPPDEAARAQQLLAEVGGSEAQQAQQQLQQLEGHQMASTDDALRQLVVAQLAAGNSVSATARSLAQRLRLPRSRLYALALEVQQAQQQSSGEVHSGQGLQP